MKNSNTSAPTATSITLLDIVVPSAQFDSGKSFGKAFYQHQRTIDGRAAKQADIVRELLSASAGEPSTFAGLASGFASSIPRDNWNSTATQFRKLAKEAGYTVSMTNDRDKENKLAHLLKASIVKIDVEADQAARDKAKKEKDSASAKEFKTAVDDAVNSKLASVGDTVPYPTTQVAKLDLIEQLMSELTPKSVQILAATVSKALDKVNADIPATTDEDLQAANAIEVQAA